MALENMDNELIADGHHVTPSAIKALLAAKGKDHIVLITDCMEAGMMPDGDYMLGELPVYVKDGMARLKEGDNLAGSVLQLKDGVKNLVDWGLAGKEEAVLMASYNPARSQGLLDKCGAIRPGLPADFLILKDDMFFLLFLFLLFALLLLRFGLLAFLYLLHVCVLNLFLCNSLFFVLFVFLFLLYSFFFLYKNFTTILDF